MQEPAFSLAEAHEGHQRGDDTLRRISTRLRSALQSFNPPTLGRFPRHLVLSRMAMPFTSSQKWLAIDPNYAYLSCGYFAYCELYRALLRL